MCNLPPTGSIRANPVLVRQCTREVLTAAGVAPRTSSRRRPKLGRGRSGTHSGRVPWITVARPSPDFHKAIAPVQPQAGSWPPRLVTTSRSRAWSHTVVSPPPAFSPNGPCAGRPRRRKQRGSPRRLPAVVVSFPRRRRWDSVRADLRVARRVRLATTLAQAELEVLRRGEGRGTRPLLPPAQLPGGAGGAAKPLTACVA